MNDEYVVHGPAVENVISSQTSLGEVLYNSLVQYQDTPVALVDAYTGNTVSYKTLLEKSCQLAVWLRSLRIGPDDIIGIFSENNVSYFYPVLAAIYLGNPVTTFNSQYTYDELLHTLSTSKPAIIFCSEMTLDTLMKLKDHTIFKSIKAIIVINSDQETINGVQTLKNVFSSCSSFNHNDFKPNKIYSTEKTIFILYSSGTTGLPKGVQLTHKSILYSIALSKDPRYASLDSNTSIGLLPFYHFYGLMSFLNGMYHGRKAVVMESFDPEFFLSSLQKYKVKILHVVPPLANFLSKSPLTDKYDLSSIQAVVCAAAPLSKKTEEALIKKLKNVKELGQVYGLTEAVPILGFPKDVGVFQPGSCGRVLPGLSVKIVDPKTGRSLGPGKPGEICCKGDIVTKGYLNNPEATKALFDQDGWLHTGDVAYYDENGYFYIVDRIKELIKYKGFQVAPAELEALLLNHPKIMDAAVVGLPDKMAGELPLAFVVVNAGDTLTEKEVKDFVAKKVSLQKQLRGGVRFVEEIPKNPSGKILRRKLRDSLKQKSKL